jgi:hypothetical protein
MATLDVDAFGEEPKVEWNYEARVEVQFAEDLLHSDVAPLLDALSSTSVFEVRSSRVAWSGPAAGGPEVGLILAAVATIGGAAFAKTFCEELAKDAYGGVRSGVIRVVKRLRERRDRRAIVPLVIEVGTMRFCLGSHLEQLPDPREWTDEWLVERLREAQVIVDAAPSLTDPQPREPETIGPVGPCEHWLK